MEKEISLGTNLYDLNKQAFSTQPKLTKKEIEKKKPALKAWFNWQIDGYAMLLCRERYDFTIFHLYEKQNPNPPAIAVDELIAALQNRGDIYAIDENEQQKLWEIWIKINQDFFVYYLFNCDEMVIES